jgi:hypothetical protein
MLSILSYPKREAAHFSKTSVNIYQAMQCHIPKDSNQFTYNGDLKSNVSSV